ncbi:MAG: DUF2917 domain-containing protein [Candidatus Methylomirabilales bacterium]
MNGDNRGTAIFCLEGIAWVTQEGDLQDHMLRPGEEFVISRAGLVVVQGIPDAEIQISSEGMP